MFRITAITLNNDLFAPLWKGRVRRQDLRTLTNNTECHERGDDAALMHFHRQTA